MARPLTAPRMLLLRVRPADRLLDARRCDEQDGGRIRLTQRRQRRLDEVHRAHERELIRRVELVVVEVREDLSRWTTGVDDQRVEPSELGHRALDRVPACSATATSAAWRRRGLHARAPRLRRSARSPRSARTCRRLRLRRRTARRWHAPCPCSTRRRMRRVPRAPDPRLGPYQLVGRREVPQLSVRGYLRTGILIAMAGELGRDWSLPLLPAGAPIFDSLPFGALVLDVLAPASGTA